MLGEYSLALPAPGSYQVEAGLSELPERQRVLRLDVLPGQCQRVNFSAIPMGSIRGRLLDADGHGVAGELVEIRGCLLRSTQGTSARNTPKPTVCFGFHDSSPANTGC